MRLKILLYPHADRDKGLVVTKRVAQIISERGCEPIVINAPGGGKKLEALFTKSLNDASFVIAFGGDGTMLRAARHVMGSGVPMIGVNMGGKGFLTEIELPQLEDAVFDILDGNYSVKTRMTLDVELLRGGQSLLRDVALNDVIIRGRGKVIELTVSGDGDMISRFAGDGLIVSTPTGSTGYSMSAGGPIVEPTAQVMLVTPICAHVLISKPYVLVADRIVTVELGSGKLNPTYISVDGKEHTRVAVGDIVRIRKSDKDIKLAHIEGRSFYKRVSEKLGEWD